MSVHVFDTMGTTVSLRILGSIEAVEAGEAGVLQRVAECFDVWDRRFSLYRPDSEISRVARGDLALSRSSESLLRSYARALEWRTVTDDAFTPHRPDGVIDLSGIVKAEAMEDAATLLAGAGLMDWLLDVGGDVLARGHADGSPWRIGVVDPADRSALLCLLDLDDTRPALVTSGTAERGEHVWRSDRGSGTTPYTQVTVRAADIVTADVAATAILAGGQATYDALADRLDIDVLTADASGCFTATPRFRGALGLASV